ncbi:uncharacterized protein [Haliotis asinina]|uniref:uncharacterized protein n=1 Tax=Haliotis asinina TaxID=109174 RepID=UPI003531D673
MVELFTWTMSRYERNEFRVKTGVISTLTRRVKNICSANLHDEIEHLRKVFVERNHYPPEIVNRTIEATLSTPTKRPKPASAPIKISIPYVGKTSHQISRILKQQANIDTTFSASPSLNNLLNANGRKQPTVNSNNPKCVIYKINCDCGQSYIGETSRPIKTRVKEHRTSVTNSDSKSAISDHIKKTPNHQIEWSDITILANNQTDFTKRKLTEAIHIKRQKPTINRDQGYFIPSAYDPLLYQAQSVV